MDDGVEVNSQKSNDDENARDLNARQLKGLVYKHVFVDHGPELFGKKRVHDL
jgi:hypothetical protein